jgi:hypothetical protein
LAWQIVVRAELDADVPIACVQQSHETGHYTIQYQISSVKGCYTVSIERD